MADYVRVGTVNEFPPGYVRGLKVNGEDVAVANVDGKLYAFKNACTHEDVDIAEMPLDGNRLTCWFHGSVFDVETGKAVVGPAYRPLPLYNVRIEGDEVLVGKD